MVSSEPVIILERLLFPQLLWAERLFGSNSGWFLLAAMVGTSLLKVHGKSLIDLGHVQRHN